MNSTSGDFLKKMGTWPAEVQDELAELAREIEARRTGRYDLDEAERAAIDEGRRSAFASEKDANAFWSNIGR